MKLWPLDPKTGARSSSLKTGHLPPSIAELASRTSASMDIEILVGRDGLAAVAKAEATAKAEEAATKAKEAAAKAAAVAAAALGAAESAPAAEASLAEGGETTSTATKSTEEGAEQHPCLHAIELLPSAVEADGTVDTAAAATTTSAAPQGTSTGIAATDEKAAATEPSAAPRPRKLALEVEVFAIGSINVPYLMALIKVSFEQVCAGWRFPFLYRSSNVAGRLPVLLRYCPPLEHDPTPSKMK